MSEILDLEQDAQEQRQLLLPKNEALSLEQVVALGQQLLELQRQTESLEHQLATSKEALRELAEERLPAALHRLGLKGLPLSTGETINVEDLISVTITEEQREAAHAWLRANNLGDLIKNEVVVTFGKGEDAQAQHLLSLVQNMRDSRLLTAGSVQQVERVHPSTLKAFVKQQVKEGEPLPAALFKLYVGQVARVSLAKKKG